MQHISIIILAQHPALTRKCAANIVKHTASPFELIIVNDGNSPEISEIGAEISGLTYKITSTPHLSGVAAGYNRGAELASGDRMVFLRDHILVTENWLGPLNRCLDHHPRAAIAGPLAHGVSGSQHIHLPVSVLLKMKAEDRSKVLAANGADLATSRLLSFLMMVRRNMFQELGGFDERFVLESYEDDDLCYRALTAGYELYIARESLVEFTSPPSLYKDDPDWFNRRLAANRQTGIDKWNADLTDLLQEWRRPVTVSLCMIVKNEQETLGRCLSSVAHLVQEIILVDTGSSDNTKAIAESYSARIFDFEWVNDFAKARNYAFRQATQEYILWLDADDILLPEDQEQFRQLIQGLPVQTDAVSMHYHLHRDEHGNVTSSLRRNRLVRRSMGFQWIGMVHEYLQVHGNIMTSNLAVTHDRVHTASSRNLHIYEAKLQEKGQFGPRDMYYYANELFDHKQWEKAAAQYEELLEQKEVWIEDRIGACGRAAECYHNLGDYAKARGKALQAGIYALPRAENCCRIGQSYLSESRYKEAIWWYKLASQLEMPSDTQALLIHSCWTWVPYLQLCVCYDRLGEYKLAYDANEQAARYIPQDSRIAANRAYLSGKLLQGAGV